MSLVWEAAPSIPSSDLEFSACRGIAAAMLGPAAFLAYLVCIVLIGLVGLCFAEVCSRVANGGGLYGYASEAFGPIVGGITGTLLWVANSVAANAAVANLAGRYARIRLSFGR